MSTNRLTFATENDWLLYYAQLNKKATECLKQSQKNLIYIAKRIGGLETKIQLFDKGE
jgi:hypothetical protein